MNTTQCKLMIIKKLLHQVEDDCYISLLLQNSTSNEHNDTSNSMNIQICFEIVQHIMVMEDVPDNIRSIRVYVAPDDHVQRIEFYSAQLPFISDDIEIDLRWLEEGQS